MKTLLKNGTVINVFTCELERANVLIENDIVLGVGDYACDEADAVEDVAGKFICPGFIDGHIHIESTLLTPAEFARVCVVHGTTAVMADPHEIANVCGLDGINYMLEASKNLPLTVYYTLPSCVPATPFDEAGAVLKASDLKGYYADERIVGLGEVMNYLGVIAGDAELLKKIADAKAARKTVNGHSPTLDGKELDKYAAAGICDDHECCTAAEAKERIRRGQWAMLRQGTAAQNLQRLLPLFDEPYYASRCLLVTDDKHCADLISHGHIDAIINSAIAAGRSVLTAIRMATIQAAQCFNLKYTGAVAPGYVADLLVLNDLNTVKVSDVYHRGKKVVDNGKLINFVNPEVNGDLLNKVRNSFKLNALRAEDFYIEPASEYCRTIVAHAGSLLTDELICKIDWSKSNGISVDDDILKLAVIERHLNTGHIGRGFIKGIGLKRGALASSVSHDSHNIIVIGTNDDDMAFAANSVRKAGGCAVVLDGKVIEQMALPIAGLMSELPAREVATQNERLRNSVYELGVPDEVKPFMLTAFMSLSVIPKLKLTTQGLVDVDSGKLVSLYV